MFGWAWTVLAQPAPPLAPSPCAALRWADMVDDDSDAGNAMGAWSQYPAGDAGLPQPAAGAAAPFLWPSTVLAVVNVPADGDCLFHALAYFFGGSAGAFRQEVVEFLEQQAFRQPGFEGEWLDEACRLRAGAWGGHTAVVATSLMKNVRVKVHIVEASGIVSVEDVCHFQVPATSPDAATIHLLYTGQRHYDALAPLVLLTPVPQQVEQPWPNVGGQLAGHAGEGGGEGDLGRPASKLERRAEPPQGPHDFLRCMLGSTGGGPQPPPMEDGQETDLDSEVYQYICAVMHPEAHYRWGRLALWQTDLQERCKNHDFASPFWHAIVYNLDIGLHLEVEAFVRLLLTEALNLDLLDGWQKKLRHRARGLWFQHRLWFDLVHHANLRGGAVQVRLSLANLVKRAGNQQGTL